MIAGSEVFLLAYSSYHRSRLAFIFSDIAIIVFAVFSIMLSLNTSAISFEPVNAAPYLYSLTILFVAFLFWRRITRLAQALSRFADFFNLLTVMVALVAVSALFYSSYEVIKDLVGMPEYQIVYISHFMFYGGLSVMFVAFQKLARMGGGALDDVKNREIN